MEFTPVLIVEPETSPVSLAEAKAHLRVDGSDDDALISIMVDAAVGHLDGWRGSLGRCLVNQTWRQDFAEWPSDGILRLPFPDVSAIDSVTYYDSEDAEQTVAGANYERASDALGGYVALVASWSAPSLSTRIAPVAVTFTAGFGAEATDVPAAIRGAILLMVGNLYANREATAPAAAVAELPMGASMLLRPYRRMEV